MGCVRGKEGDGAMGEARVVRGARRDEVVVASVTGTSERDVWSASIDSTMKRAGTIALPGQSHAFHWESSVQPCR